DELAPKVSLITDKSGADAAEAKPLTQIKVFEGDIAYLRITRVEEGLAKAVKAGYEQLKSTNKVSGIVLDLRYAGGSDYDAAEALAAMVRETGSGLILGSQTAGAAMVMQDYPLKNGEHLRIASAPVTLGDGAVLPTKGIKP